MRRANDAKDEQVDRGSPVAQAALAFAVSCHAGQRRDSDGASFIEHPVEVAGLLRDAGCSDVLVAAGLLHDVIEVGHVDVAELAARFGWEVTGLVQAVTDGGSVASYRERKQAVREGVREAGGDAALLFAADRISKVRELPDRVRRDQARFAATARDGRERRHLEYYVRTRLEHHHESLRMLQRVAPRHPLVDRLARELGSCPISRG